MFSKLDLNSNGWHVVGAITMTILSQQCDGTDDTAVVALRWHDCMSAISQAADDDEAFLSVIQHGLSVFEYDTAWSERF